MVKNGYCCQLLHECVALSSDSCNVLDSDRGKLQCLKGAKADKCVSSEEFDYDYPEGGMVFSDAVDNAS